MKILHTSDWHLGRSLYGRKRYDEFAAFLDWLSDTIETQAVDVLVVAGDIFDNSTPSNRAQELYYRFLCKVANSCCRHVVVIAGNHDSPSFLNAPKELLRALNVYVVGAMTERPEDEVIVLHDGQNNPEAIVCAVPYLRDKDIRTVEAGETIDDKNAKLMEGIQKHYAEVVAIAEQKSSELILKSKIPIIAMGHLFAAGGQTVEGDGVKELYIGSLAQVAKEVFPPSIDYLALGHLHVPQCVGGTDHIRYSGSPIPMGFGESRQQKRVVLIEFGETAPLVQDLPVPCFQQLERVTGSLDEIHKRLEKLKQDDSSAWLEIEYTGKDVIGNIREMLDETLAGSGMEILRVKNKQLMDRVMSAIHEDETLDDLDENDVFERCLESFAVPLEERAELTVSYKEIIKSLHEEDVNAE